MTEAAQDEVPAIDIVDDKPLEVDLDRTEEATADQDPRAAIYAKHKERRGQEQEGVPVGTDAAPKDAEDPAPQPAQDELVTVKINGREKKVSRAKVDEAGGLDIYQKRLAAEENMRQAAEEKRRVQEYEQQLVAKAHELQRFEQEIKRRAVQQPATPPPQNQDEVKQMARRYHEAMLNGDLDQADELLIKLQGAQKQATPDADAIARKAAAEARAALEQERQRDQQIRFEQERVEAVQRFEDEFSDIADDPDLREWADTKTLKISRENPQWSPARIIEEAARQVRDAIGKTVTPAESSSKLEAKRSMTNVKGGSARAVAKPQPKPPTKSQYVESLRKQRGLE